MARYKLDIIESLARQMAFAPNAVRERQLTAAEEFLLEITPDNAYAVKFVVFRITGFQAKSGGRELLTGLALQHDLGLLIERVSETLAQKTTDRAEPVLMIDDLVARFNVTSKTIQRWRRRGLAARRFIFPDGKRRVGFRLGVVERFLAVHEECAESGANFSQIESSEASAILRHARRLSASRCTQDEIARRIARRLNRSPLTILSTIQKHDAEHPDAPVFVGSAAPLSDDESAAVRSGVAAGESLLAIAHGLKRNRAELYATVLADRLHRITQRRVKFIDDPLYHGPEAEHALAAMRSPEALSAPAPLEDRRIPADLPAYLRSLYRFPLLSPAQERALFLEFNYRKFCFVTA
ncbi:MAG: hypothetical protein ACTHM6_05650, partial [Tepidisphaeraceae bacterium]